MRMPGGLDGLETVNKIFEIEENIQIIFCSAYSDYNWKDMVSMLEHTDRWVILKKPFDVIEARQLTISLCDKWQLLLEMKGKISKQTEDLRVKLDELKTAQNEIKHLAYYDSLTNLPNRFLFRELLKQDIEEAKRNKSLVGLFFLDIDNFKRINDAYVHDIGDKLLIAVTNRLKGLLRKSDVIARNIEGYEFQQGDIIYHSMVAARLGGDEFTVILKNLKNKNDILGIADRIIEAISNTNYEINHTKFKVTASIGVAIFPSDGKDPDSLLKNADIAMYQAKAKGKNQIVLHNKKLNEEIIKRHLLVQDIYKGLKNNELYLVYQPKVSVKTSKIIGCEALIRWQHPTHGLLQPKDFIPIAEESELIIEIDCYVLDAVCKQISQWKAHNFFKNIVTSMNVSTKFFNQDHIVSLLKDTLLKYEVKPQELEIEITEAYLAKSRQRIIQCLDEMRQVLGEGIKISIDDFGTGYSSLAYLNEFPIDTVKIDQSFIEKANEENDKSAIINAIIELSHSLQYNVIAEGVETKEQFQFLKKAKCDEVQGFLFEKPMMPEDFLQFLKKSQVNKKKK